MVSVPSRLIQAQIYLKENANYLIVVKVLVKINKLA